MYFKTAVIESGHRYLLLYNGFFFCCRPADFCLFHFLDHISAHRSVLLGSKVTELEKARKFYAEEYTKSEIQSTEPKPEYEKIVKDPYVIEFCRFSCSATSLWISSVSPGHTAL